MKRLLLLAVGLAGLVASVFAFRGGARAQERIDYYPSGQVQSACTTDDGVREGRCQRFWPDGTLQAEGEYQAGTMTGAWTFWNADGTEDAARSGNYAGGRRVDG